MERPAKASPNNVFLAAVWLGLVTGLLEGAGLVALDKLGQLTWILGLGGASVELIWISPTVNVLLFTTVGSALVASSRVFPRLKPVPTAVLLFTSWMFTDWLLVLGRVRARSALVLAIGLALVFMRWCRKHQPQVLRFWRRSLPWLVLLFLIAFLGIQGTLWAHEQLQLARLPAASAGSPNILMIVMDTVRSDHLSAYGYHRTTSPNLEQIAQDGVLFENPFATSSWTVPSHASLLTGQHPHQHRAEDAIKPLDGRYHTISEVLSSRGYRTAAFSANTLFFTRRLGFARGFAHFEDYFHSVADMAARTMIGRQFAHRVLPRLGYEDYPARRRAADINRSASRWMDGQSRRPFFVLLNYFDTHAPYLPPDSYLAKFSTPTKVRDITRQTATVAPADLSAEQLQVLTDAYDAAIAYVDYHVGALMSELKKRGLAHNTIVIITSDHGESLGEHALFGHREALYRDQIQVPLIVWGPGRLPAGIRVTTPVSNAALAATVMDLLGDGNKRIFPGPSLASLWNGDDGTHWPLPLAELARLPYGRPQFPAYHGSLKCLVTPEWHYIEHETLGRELYRWRDDPSESNNLAATEAGKAVVKDLGRAMQAIVTAAHN